MKLVVPSELCFERAVFGPSPAYGKPRKLGEAFGDNPGGLLEASKLFCASKRDFGDSSIELLALPRIPITIVLWAGNDEFPARASMLFDKTAAEHLPLDALWTLANVSAKALIDASQGP